MYPYLRYIDRFDVRNDRTNSSCFTEKWRGGIKIKRLTEWTGYEWIAKQERVDGKYITDRDVYNKLAAYEDIGLEPDEMRKLFGKLEQYEWKYGSAEAAMDYAEYTGKLW